MPSSPSATERPFRPPLMAAAFACAASLALHAAAAGFALYQFQAENGAAPRAPVEVSIAQNVTEPLDSVAAEDTLAADAEPGSAETLPEPRADELRPPPPDESSFAEENPPHPDAVRPSADLAEAPPAESARPGPDVLAEPPLQSLNARDAAPAAAAEAPRDKPAKAKKSERDDKPSREAERETERKADAARKRAARKADTAKLESARKEKSAPRAKPGAPSRQADKARQAGRASASAGAVASFAAQVRAAVARRRPGASGASGTAIVSFGLRPGGGLAAARLSRSSGNARLDSLALGAVRGAAFPRPPAGASPAQLRFTIPFHFR